MNVDLHLLRYLKDTPDLGIFFNNRPDLSLTTYCDSDRASCPDSWRFLIGYCVVLGGSLVG